LQPKIKQADSFEGDSVESRGLWKNPLLAFLESQISNMPHSKHNSQWSTISSDQSWKVQAKGRFSNELAFLRLDFMKLERAEGHGAAQLFEMI
jgi:hypothetical protein